MSREKWNCILHKPDVEKRAFLIHTAVWGIAHRWSSQWPMKAIILRRLRLRLDLQDVRFRLEPGLRALTGSSVGLFGANTIFNPRALRIPMKLPKVGLPD